MGSFVRALTKVDNILARGEAWTLIALVAAMTVTVFLQVIYRYVLAQPLQWSEELARFLFVWIALLGAALCVHKRAHFGMDFFVAMLSQRGMRVIAIVVYILMGAVMVVLLVFGIVLVQKTAAQQSPAMEVSMGWVYACLPLGATLMLIHLISILVQEAIGTTETS